MPSQAIPQEISSEPPAAQSSAVLYLGSDYGLARLLEVQLDRHGYRVGLTTDEAQGLELVRQGGYQVVLVDCHVPEGGGIAVLAGLLKIDPLLPVVMLTDNGDEHSAVEAMKLGASDYLLKDQDYRYLELLPMVLEKILMGRRLAEEREKTLRSIKESEERYRKLVELSPDGIVICCRSRIEFANPAAVRLLGAQNPEQILGVLILGFVHPDSVDLFQAQLALIEASGVDVPWLEERFVMLDYSQLDVEVSGIHFTYCGQSAVQIIFRDITSRIQAKQLLERLAYYDQLTSLPNRALFFDRLGMQVAQASRYGFDFGLLYLDLDGFKEVNDTMGHDQGDRLLVQVARRLEQGLRVSDTVARIGGDEFVVILARIGTAQDAAVVAGKLVEALKAPFELEGGCCSIAGSVGISRFPVDGRDADALLGAADRAMYRAKETGGSRFSFANEPRETEPLLPSGAALI